MPDVVLKTVSFRQNSFITIENKSNSEDFYIIRSGKVQLIVELKLVEDPAMPSVLTTGDFFGVVSCMSNHNRLETAVALTDVSLIAINRDQFGVLIQKNAPIAMKIIRHFSKRLRLYDSEIAKLTLKNEVKEENIESLFNIGEYYFKLRQFNYAAYVYKKYLKYCLNGKYLSTTTVRLQALGVNPSELNQSIEIPDNSMTRSYPNDSMIFCENEPGEELYIIQQGKVKIVKILNDKEILLAVLKETDMFGEMALLENKPRTASAIAFGDCVLLVVNKKNFESMVVQKPQIATRLIQLLSERIWIAYKQLENLTIKTPIARVFDTLYTQIEKLRIPIEHRASHTFELRPKEILDMLGFTPQQGEQLIADILKNKKFELINNKIHCSDLEELQKQVEYYKKMEEMERKREQAANKT